MHITLMLNYLDNVASAVAKWHKSQVAHRDVFGYF